MPDALFWTLALVGFPLTCGCIAFGRPLLGVAVPGMVLAVAIGVGVVALATDDSCDGATQPDCVIIESGLDPVLYGLAFSIPGEVGAFVGLLAGAAVRRRDRAAVG